MKISIYNKIGCFLAFWLFVIGVNAQQVWEKTTDNQFVLDTEGLNSKLKKISISSPKIEIIFPNMEGDLTPFIIYDNAVLPQELANKYPQIHSYKGVSKHDSSLVLRFTCVPFGIEGTLIQGNRIVNLMRKNSKGNYFLLRDRITKNQRTSFDCVSSKKSQHTIPNTAKKRSRKAIIGDNRFIVIRLALVTTGEISNFFIRKSNVQSGTDAEKKAAILAGVSTSVNNINVAFERDLGVRFQLIPNNDALFFLNKDTDPFNDSEDLDALLNQIGDVITSRVPFNSYDMGHLLAFNGGGGLAAVASPCKKTKAEAVTSFSIPEGFYFDFTLFAHELGHQLGGLHTQSASCNVETPVEVGSGTTIMGYSGACRANDVQSESDPYFHSLSVEQIRNVLRGLDVRGDCGVQISTVDNSIPVIPELKNYVVPLGLPIYLEALAQDANSEDVLMYSWEQFDRVEGISPSPPIATSTSGPQFRVFSPITSPRRDFPTSGIDSKWEVLPTVPRMLNFKLFVRDGKSGGVAISSTVKVSIVSTTEKFKITQPKDAVTYSQNETVEIKWDVAKTNQSPFNVDNVKIEYSYDGGITYPVVLANSLPNTGSGFVKIPIITNPESIVFNNGKIRISAIENAFYTFTKNPITLVRFPIVSIREFQDLSSQVLIFRIKSSFPAPKDISFTAEFSNAIDQNMVVDIMDKVQVSKDGGVKFEPPTGDDFLIEAGQTELFLAIPLNTTLDNDIDFEKLRINLTISEGAENLNASGSGFLIDRSLPIVDNIIISPNPSNGVVTLTTQVIQDVDLEVKIYSITGKLVFEKKPLKFEQELDLEFLAPGLYLVRIELTGQLATKKLLIL